MNINLIDTFGGNLESVIHLSVRLAVSIGLKAVPMRFHKKQWYQFLKQYQVLLTYGLTVLIRYLCISL
jgi:hypothetical protein